MLNAFPRVTSRGHQLRLEEVNHGEVSVQHQLGRRARIEMAAYHDYFQNAAVWGFGRPSAASAWLRGNILPNPISGGLIVNGWDYGSSGIRATYSMNLGSHMGAALDYALGEALTVNSTGLAGDARKNIRRNLRAEPSRSFGGKIWTRVPVSNTRIITSYQCLQRGRLTSVDPYGQADLAIHPFLGLQIRQPLPTLSFLPAHIEALADFRDLLGQGYTSLPHSGGKSFLLTSAYRSLRGGFSVQF
jgi:hypothetical protein